MVAFRSMTLLHPMLSFKSTVLHFAIPIFNPMNLLHTVKTTTEVDTRNQSISWKMNSNIFMRTLISILVYSRFVEWSLDFLSLYFATSSKDTFFCSKTFLIHLVIITSSAKLKFNCTITQNQVHSIRNRFFFFSIKIQLKKKKEFPNSSNHRWVWDWFCFEVLLVFESVIIQKLSFNNFLKML